MGLASADKYSLYCSIESGILFSNVRITSLVLNSLLTFFLISIFVNKTLMVKMKQEMEWCTRNAFSVDATENIGRCVLHSANLKCTQTSNVIKEILFLFLY